MKIQKLNTDATVLGELGERLKRRRLNRNITQEDLANESGISRSGLQRVESGEPVSTQTLVRVLRGLDLLDSLEVAIPEDGPSPIEMLKLQEKTRKRAAKKSSKPAETEPWLWGDDQA